MNAKGEVASIERVKDELYAIEDELSVWAKDKDKGFFLPTDKAVVPAFAKVSL